MVAEDLTSSLQKLNGAGGGLSLEHTRICGEDVGRETCTACGHKALCIWETMQKNMNEIIEDETKKVCMSYS